jgi:hypothetical protein
MVPAPLLVVLTAATNSVLPPSVSEAGAAVRAVVVCGGLDTNNGVLPLEPA